MATLVGDDFKGSIGAGTAVSLWYGPTPGTTFIDVLAGDDIFVVVASDTDSDVSSITSTFASNTVTLGTTTQEGIVTNTGNVITALYRVPVTGSGRLYVLNVSGIGSSSGKGIVLGIAVRGVGNLRQLGNGSMEALNRIIGPQYTSGQSQPQAGDFVIGAHGFEGNLADNDTQTTTSAGGTPNFDSASFITDATSGGGAASNIGAALTYILSQSVNVGVNARVQYNIDSARDGAGIGAWYAPAATGPQNLTRTATDAVSVSESATRTFGGFRTTTGTVAVVEDAVAQIVQSLSRTATDGVSAGDSATRTSARSRSAADAVAAADAASRIVGRARTATDSVTLAELASKTTSRSRTATDAVSLAESATLVKGISRSASDAAAVADLATRASGLLRSGADAVAVADAVTRIVSAARSGADALLLADAVTKQAGQTRTASDPLSVSDAAARASLAFMRATSDAVALSENAALNAQSLSRSAVDGLSVADSVTRSISVVRTIAEAVAVVDAATRAAQGYARTGSDPIGVIDAAVRAAQSYTRQAVDSIAFGDVVIRGSLALVRTGTDTITIFDVADRTLAGEAPLDLLGPLVLLVLSPEGRATMIDYTGISDPHDNATAVEVAAYLGEAR
jgi:hypothetical protein